MPAPLAVSTVLRSVIHHLDLTQEELAQSMRVNKRTVWKLINDRQRLTPRMAVLLQSATGKPAKEWLEIQTDYELSQVKAASRFGRGSRGKR